MIHRFLVTLLLAGAAVAQQQAPIKQARYLMGTMCEIAAYDNDRVRAGEAINSAFAEIKRIERVLSNWDASSELMRLNAAAAAPGDPRPRVKVTPELLARIHVALRIAEQTDGLFDPTVGPLVRYWGFLPATNKKETLAQVRARTGWQKIHLDDRTAQVWFEVAGMELDFGGIAKGYAVVRAADILRQRHVRSALISLGTSSIAAVGVPPGEQGWPLEVRDPLDPQRGYTWVVLHGGESLATSGTYEKRQGKNSHLIDPRTGTTVERLTGVTVIARDAEVADALAKPFLLLDDVDGAEARAIAQHFSDAAVLVLTAEGGQVHARESDTMRTRIRHLPNAVAGK